MKLENEIFSQQEITGKDLQQLLELRKSDKANFILIDVREEYEFNQKKIKGVDYLIPMSSFSVKYVEIDQFKDIPIITQCKSGARSAQAQTKLKAKGFKQVLNLSGGIINYPGETI